jgi:very-short-patch-repair endonuclease
MRDEERSFRRDLRANLTPCERLLWARLRGRQLDGFKFRRQHPVGPYIIDFFCAEKDLAIEIDGDSHYVGGQIPRDRERDAYLAQRGIRVLRFTNNDIREEMDGVLAVITGALT